MHRSDRKTSIETRLREGPTLLLDGATGTEIESRGNPCDPPLWSTRALLECPDQVRKIHRQYAEAGADIITANTFRTQRRTLKRAEHEYPLLGDQDAELTAQAVQLARAGAHAERGWVAGSVAPLEDCYQPGLVPDPVSLEEEHRRHADNLAQAGVDLILIETMNSRREAVAAARAAHATGLPFCVSFVVSSSGNLLSGESLEEAIHDLEPHSPAAVGINCLPAAFVDPGLLILQRSARRFGLHTNLGIPGAEDEQQHRSDCTPERFSRYVVRWAHSGAAWVGGCCGTTPAHTAAAHRALRAMDSPDVDTAVPHPRE